ncbi:MAG: hypothetical protein GY791_11900 [Alphaproteobacteria bacterium]|nr:hypothetical protein [Alphaproteobacteria bacterium]
MSAKIFEKWGAALVRAPIESFLDPSFRPVVEWLPLPGGDDFYADPFGVETDDGLFVFVERFDSESQKGRIAAFSIDDNGVAGAAVDILSIPVHMSYPFIFEDEGQVYCCPEIFQANGAYLFRAESLPGRWRSMGPLIDGLPLVDPTIVRHDGRYWLWATVRLRGLDRAGLHLWHAESLFGPWHAHPANPVKVDAGSARPGGTPFVHDGVLYRPAQNCAKTYGGSLVINRVLVLSPTEYTEEPAIELFADPTWPFPDGFHTISRLGNMTLIDGKRIYPELEELAPDFNVPPEPDELAAALDALRDSGRYWPGAQ